MPRYAARIDDNQRVIVDALSRAGASVESLAAVGRGVPDLLVGFQGVNYLLEVKDGEKPPSARRLTAAQVNWHRSWRGRVHVVTCVLDALRTVGAVKGGVT